VSGRAAAVTRKSRRIGLSLRRGHPRTCPERSPTCHPSRSLLLDQKKTSSRQLRVMRTRGQPFQTEDRQLVSQRAVIQQRSDQLNVYRDCIQRGKRHVPAKSPLLSRRGVDQPARSAKFPRPGLHRQPARPDLCARLWRRVMVTGATTRGCLQRGPRHAAAGLPDTVTRNDTGRRPHRVPVCV
jgi:hypothetical protein